MCQIDFVLEMECSPLGGMLPLPCETFKHTFLRCESGIIFAKTSVNYSACAVLFFEIFEKSFLPLRKIRQERLRCMHDSEWDVKSTHCLDNRLLTLRGLPGNTSKLPSPNFRFDLWSMA